MRTFKQHLDEKWTEKYKRSIDCANPKGFSQRAHCQGRKKNEEVEILDEKGRCWPGHRPVPGKKPFSPGSCVKEDHVEKLEQGLKQLDSHDYDSIDSLMKKISKDENITPKELHDDFKSKHGKTPDDWIKDKSMNEDLRKWFKQKWVRMDTKGNIKGQCARDPGEGKPKCLPQAKAHALGKEGRAAAARRKRREDPNPERRGKPIFVRTK